MLLGEALVGGGNLKAELERTEHLLDLKKTEELESAAGRQAPGHAGRLLDELALDVEEAETRHEMLLFETLLATHYVYMAISTATRDAASLRCCFCRTSIW